MLMTRYIILRAWPVALALCVAVTACGPAAVRRSPTPAGPGEVATKTPAPTTAVSTGTPSPTATPAATATATRVPASPTSTSAPSATPLVCSTLPEGGFLTIWQGDPDLRAALGCPTSYHPRVIPRAWEVKTAFQPFEHGTMIWSDHIGWYPQPVIYVLYADSTYERLEDTYDPEVDPVSGGETPPEGLTEPILGFGKVWREQPGIRDRLGWGTTDESPGVGRFQLFWGGQMLWISQTNQTYVFTPTRVDVFQVPFAEE